MEWVVNIYGPLSSVPGGEIMIENNPPPILNTAESYFLNHFMTVLSERTAHGSLPVTKVIQYALYTGYKDTDSLVRIINSVYSNYTTITNKRDDKERIKANGK